MKIGLLGNASKNMAVAALEEIASYLSGFGYETVTFFSPQEIDGVDVLLVVGGDGSILHAAVPAAKKNIKIIGINYGTIGFLTEYEQNERNDVAEMLSALEKGKCPVAKRSVLHLSVRGKEFFALNEFVLQRDSSLPSENFASTQILRLKIKAKAGSDEIVGDGVLFCTPTGSTAYSLSAGGAILSPEVPVFMMTPICAFSTRSRPIVFSDTEEFLVTVEKGSAVIMADGRAVERLSEGESVSIKKAPFTADFPIREGANFFARVRNKLNV
ncbi:MAG: NAD(+)/NADH kinase [Clostridia bacterium]|nr:NAD(+)/NADH kinase [Clostridia bacterium]